MKRNVTLFYPYIPKEKILKELEDTLSGRWIAQGPKVKKFEQIFGEMFDYKYPVMLNSGTSALELSYHLIGLKEGDEVIVPVLDCTAGQMGLKRRGINIVFADVDDQLNVSVEDVRSKITPKTKAIVGVHLGGIPFNPQLNILCREAGIPLIVDAAQHHDHLEGDFICYSFQAIKHINTGDGGMLVLQDEQTYQRAKLLRWFGIDRDLKERMNYKAWEKREMTFDIEEPGFKYQPNDIAACLGLAAIHDLPAIIKYRKKLCEIYLKDLPPQCTPICGGSYWLFGILSDKRDDLADFLTAEGVENNLIHLRNDIYRVFGGVRQNLPNMNRLEPKYLYLPLNNKISEDDVYYVCEKVNEFYAK